MTIAGCEFAGVKAILVHAISEEAKSYDLAKGFIASPMEPMTHCLVRSTSRQVLTS